MSPEQLLLSSVSYFLSEDSLSVDIQDESFWAALFTLSQEQKLIPIVYEVLHDSIPSNLQSEWRSSAVLQTARQTAQSAEFLELYKDLLKEGFSPLVVKGIVCQTTYKKPDLRISADDDVYIEHTRYMEFHQILKKMGFQSISSPDYKNAHEERYARNGFLLEGHWELFPQEHALLNSLNVYAEAFWKRAKTVLIQNVPILTLEPTDHMIFLLLHAFKHFIGSGFGIRQICDIAQWSKTHDIEWDRVHSVLADVHAEYFAAAVFGICESYFGMTYPSIWDHCDYSLLLEDSLRSGIYGASSMSRKHSSTITLGAVESRYRGTRNIPLLTSVFPKRSVMEMSFPWVRKSFLLLPAAWSIRIFRYLRSQGKNNSSSETIQIGAERTDMLKYYKII